MKKMYECIGADVCNDAADIDVDFNLPITAKFTSIAVTVTIAKGR